MTRLVIVLFVAVAIYALAIGLLVADAVLAAETAVFGGRGSQVALVERDSGCPAEVRILNKVTDVVGAYDVDLNIYDFVVSLHAVIGDGSDPDTVEVLPREGFLAVPPRVTLLEEEQTVVLICPIDGVGA